MAHTGAQILSLVKDRATIVLEDTPPLYDPSREILVPFTSQYRNNVNTREFLRNLIDVISDTLQPARYNAELGIEEYPCRGHDIVFDQHFVKRLQRRQQRCQPPTINDITGLDRGDCIIESNFNSNRRVVRKASCANKDEAAAPRRHYVTITNIFHRGSRLFAHREFAIFCITDIRKRPLILNTNGRDTRTLKPHRHTQWLFKQHRVCALHSVLYEAAINRRSFELLNR